MSVPQFKLSLNYRIFRQLFVNNSAHYLAYGLLRVKQLSATKKPHQIASAHYSNTYYFECSESEIPLHEKGRKVLYTSFPR